MSLAARHQLEIGRHRCMWRLMRGAGPARSRRASFCSFALGGSPAPSRIRESLPND